MISGVRLGIDFGTSNTAAVMRTASGRVQQVLFDSFPLLPSAVCAVDGKLLTGRDAQQWANSHPDAFEPTPKRCIDDGTLLLGRHEFTVEEVMAAVLTRVLTEASQVTGGDIDEVVLTHPAGWGPYRREILAAAARRAGAANPRLLPEPIAAAWLLTTIHEQAMPAGQAIIVYDLGAGTFDASVVHRTPDGFAVLAAEGLPDAGGLDIDAALLSYIAAALSTTDRRIWHRLLNPDTASDTRSSRQLRDEIRGAKEMLSRTSSASVYLPLLDTDTIIGRDQLEVIARPILARTVTATKAALRACGPAIPPLAAIFLVGGSSRIPLAATLLHRAFGLAPTVLEQPELVVAQGSVVEPYETTSTVTPASPTIAPAAPNQAKPARPAATAPAAPATNAPATNAPAEIGPVASAPAKPAPAANAPAQADTAAKPAPAASAPAQAGPAASTQAGAEPEPASPIRPASADPVSVDPPQVNASAAVDTRTPLTLPSARRPIPIRALATTALIAMIGAIIVAVVHGLPDGNRPSGGSSPSAGAPGTVTATPTAPAVKYPPISGTDICSRIRADPINTALAKKPWTSGTAIPDRELPEQRSCEFRYREGDNLGAGGFIVKATAFNNEAAGSAFLDKTRGLQNNAPLGTTIKVHDRPGLGESAFTYVSTSKGLTVAGVVALDDNLVIQAEVYGSAKLFDSTQQRQNMLDTLADSARDTMAHLS